MLMKRKQTEKASLKVVDKHIMHVFSVFMAI